MGTVPNIIKSAGNQFVTTLSGSINDSTTSIQLTSATGLNTKGVLIIDEGNANEEIVYYESYLGTTLTIASDGRGYAGTTAASHSAGATVTDVLVQSHVNGIADKFLVEHTDTGTHGTITGATLTTPVIASFYQDSGLTKLMTVPNVASDTLVTLAATQTLTGKTITTPTLELANTSPTADGGIGYDRTEEELQIGDGTNSLFTRMGAWKSFTPSWTNLTVGNGTNVGSYAIHGKTCVFRTTLTFGSTTSISGAVSYTLPVTAATYSDISWIGNVRLKSAGGGFLGLINSSGSIVVLNAASTYLATNNLSSTVPATWTTGDTIVVTAVYEIA
jgi:hypothetical protein